MFDYTPHGPMIMILDEYLVERKADNYCHPIYASVSNKDPLVEHISYYFRNIEHKVQFI